MNQNTHTHTHVIIDLKNRFVVCCQKARASTQLSRYMGKKNLIYSFNFMLHAILDAWYFLELSDATKCRTLELLGRKFIMAALILVHWVLQGCLLSVSSVAQF